MNVEDLFILIKNTKGTNAKKDILRKNSGNKDFVKALSYALDPFVPFHIVKVPKTIHRTNDDTQNAWSRFFEAADKCAAREVTGNEAIALLSSVFTSSTENQEHWMRRILKKHLLIIKKKRN